MPIPRRGFSDWFGDYRRLLVFLRPHWWRMAGNVVANVIGAALGAFSYTLLVPFLNTLFKQPDPLSKAAGWASIDEFSDCTAA